METAERIEVVCLYFESGGSVTTVLRRFHAAHGARVTLSAPAIRAVVNKFLSTGSVEDAPRTGRPRSARTDETIAAVAQDVEENPSTSTRHRAQQVGVSERSLRRILHEELGVFP